MLDKRRGRTAPKEAPVEPHARSGAPLRLALAFVAVAAVLVAVIVVFNRSQPSHVEIAHARALATSAMRTLSDEGQSVLYEASRKMVSINAYGFMDLASQERLVNEVRSSLTKDMKDTRVRVLFFPPREFTVEKTVDGAQVSRFKRTAPIRRVDLN
jgi:hypothetical protein